MYRLRFGCTILSGMALLLLLTRTEPTRAGLIQDQSYEKTGVQTVGAYGSGGQDPYEAQELSQVFTVGANPAIQGGTLAQLDLYIEGTSSSTLPIVTIRKVNPDGSPGSPAAFLEGGSPQTGLVGDGTFHWVTFQLSNDIVVHQGDKFAIVLSSPDALGGGGWLWMGHEGNPSDPNDLPYDGGHAWHANTATETTSGWSDLSDTTSLCGPCVSFDFHTWVNMPANAVPEPASVISMGLGCLCLGGYLLRRKKRAQVPQ